jgi:isoleucyl-tRNA synthetase
MRYKAGQRRRASEYEPALVEWWKKNRTFEKSVEQRSIDDSYVFYDGPPFITGMPHHGTLLSSIVKDAVPRFWTMRGKRVERRWGWDCHGLPAENFVEKQLGITDRREIGTKWSLEDYILKARESMVANSETWEGTIDRIGRWVDFKGAYRTMDKDFMESVWWAFKTLYEAGKIYEGRKVLMYDTKFATPVSKSEVTMDNDAYQTVTDPSAYVKFELFDDAEGPTYFLAWTTTPWTLPANMALAVNPEMEYATVLLKETDEKLILAKSRIEVVMKGVGYEVLSECRGEDLVGLEYCGLMGEALANVGEMVKARGRVLAGDFVSDVDGTGIVHIAPAYGEDDYGICQENGVGFVDVLDEYGYYLPEAAKKLHELGVRDTDERGIEIWAGNKFIAKCLEEKGIVWKIEYIKHEYPFNPRSKQRIMYRAFPSWFFDVQNQKTLMITQNENVNWFPEYLKHGRFEKNIEQAPDWNLSRDRFWATAMPVWKGEKTGAIKVFGSYDELEKYSGKRLDDYHRPWVDEVEFDGIIAGTEILTEKEWEERVVEAEKTGADLSPVVKDHFKRIDKVLDCWFESGSMPFAQLHYPFENKEKFERNYPADFIVEYVGQVRAWFYYVHCVNTALAEVGGFGEAAKGRAEKNAFKNVITTGTLAGNDGRKMSKSLGNYTDPNELMNQYSADALRFLLLSSPVLSGEDFALTDKDVSDVQRKLAMIWNVYDFFTTYAEVDQWTSPLSSDSVSLSSSKESDLAQPVNNPQMTEKSLINPLDKWIIARLHELKRDVTEGMEEYNIPKALSGVLPFVDDLSNWFVRRSRRRFWKSEDDADKAEAYWTLWKVLSKLAQVLAPFTPFLAEELWQNVVADGNPDNSVHLTGWTEPGEIDQEILAQMKRVREVINEGLALRMQKSDTEAQIKVRQPLNKYVYAGEQLPEWGEEIVCDEVNVKTAENGAETWLDKNITEELAREGFVRELIRAVQAARKKAGLNVDDRIKLSVSCEVPEEWRETLRNEVLVNELTSGENYAYDEIAKVAGENVTISLEKV